MHRTNGTIGWILTAIIVTYVLVIAAAGVVFP